MAIHFFRNGRVADFGGAFRAHHGTGIVFFDADDRCVAAGTARDDRASRIDDRMAIKPNSSTRARDTQNALELRKWEIGLSGILPAGRLGSLSDRRGYDGFAPDTTGDRRQFSARNVTTSLPPP